MSILISILLVFHILICLLMVLVVLMQRPRSEGLGAAFGAGVADNLFGAQTTHVLQRFTVWLGGGFFALTLLLAILYARTSSSSTTIQRELLAEPTRLEETPFVPEATPTPAEETPLTPESSAAPTEVTETLVETETVVDSAPALPSPSPGLFPTPPPAPAPAESR